jgi:hypothetical protein
MEMPIEGQRILERLAEKEKGADFETRIERRVKKKAMI